MEICRLHMLPLIGWPDAFARVKRADGFCLILAPKHFDSRVGRQKVNMTEACTSRVEVVAIVSHSATEIANQGGARSTE